MVFGEVKPRSFSILSESMLVYVKMRTPCRYFFGDILWNFCTGLSNPNSDLTKGNHSLPDPFNILRVSPIQENSNPSPILAKHETSYNTIIEGQTTRAKKTPFFPFWVLRPVPDIPSLPNCKYWQPLAFMSSDDNRPVPRSLDVPVSTG